MFATKQKAAPTLSNSNLFPSKGNAAASSQPPSEEEKKFGHLQEMQFEIQRNILELRSAEKPIADISLLIGQIQEQLRRLEEKTQRVEVFAEEQDKESDRDRIMARLKRYREESSSLRADFRKANLEYQRNMQSVHAKERSELLGGKDKDKAMSEARYRQSAVLKSQHVSDSLTRSRDILAQELDRTNMTMQSLDESSKTLKRTQSEYRAYSTYVRAAKGNIWLGNFICNTCAALMEAGLNDLMIPLERIWWQIRKIYGSKWEAALDEIGRHESEEDEDEEKQKNGCETAGKESRNDDGSDKEAQTEDSDESGQEDIEAAKKTSLSSEPRQNAQQQDQPPAPAAEQHSPDHVLDPFATQ